MAASSSSYELWLSDKLLSLNPDCDTDVFVTYISSILDEDDTPTEEKKESLGSILGEVVVRLINKYCNCVIWSRGDESNSNIIIIIIVGKRSTRIPLH